MSTRTDAMIVAGGTLVVLGVLWWLKNTVANAASDAYDYAAEKVDQVVPYVNPEDDRNVVNTVFNGTWRGITGDPNWTLGGWIYDVTH